MGRAGQGRAGEVNAGKLMAAYCWADDLQSPVG